jgi:hypothetical protein
LVDLVVQLKLKTILRFSDKEVADAFWDGIFDISKNDAEVGIDSGSKFSDKNIATRLLLSHLRLLWLLLHAWTSSWISTGATDSWLTIYALNLIISHDILPIILILKVIGKEIILLRVDDGFNNFSSIVSFFVQDSNNNFHNFWDQ